MTFLFILNTFHLDIVKLFLHWLCIHFLLTIPYEIFNERIYKKENIPHYVHNTKFVIENLNNIISNENQNKI